VPNRTTGGKCRLITTLEWYDFTVYNVMAAVVFF
jgi:hypothetical protein